MFRSNKISLASANDIIDSLTESSEIMSGTGAVVITQKNGRKTTNTGKIYLRDGLIYAALIENHRIPIGKRIETGSLVGTDDLNEAFNKVGGDITSPRIVDHLLQNHMVGEKILSSYVKEHFIETLGKIMSWNDSLGEWHPNAVTNDFIMPFVTFERIREILAHRKHVYGEFLRLVEKFMRPEELPELTFSLLKAPTATQSPTTLKIISLCDAKNTINDIAEATGVTFYNVFQTIVGLWRDGFVSLNVGEIKLPYAAILVKPEPEKVPTLIELTNPPIPVHDETSEPSEAPADGVVIVDPQGGDDIASIAAEYADGDGLTFEHFANDATAGDEAVFYDPLKEAGDASDEGTAIVDDHNPDLVESIDSEEQVESVVEPEPFQPETIDDESPEVDSATVSNEANYVPSKDILDRRSKVEEITNKLNQLESTLADCENDLRDNQTALEALEERKSWLDKELAEVEQDYKRTIAKKTEIKESYELIRKEVEDTINSFTFIEGE